jgi:hypothetical protein
MRRKAAKPVTTEPPLVPAWALGSSAKWTSLTDQERRLTAAIYAGLPGVLAHVLKEGRLPLKMGPAGGAEIGVRVLVERRGINLALSEGENAVLEVLLRDGATPAGCAVLLGVTGGR